MSLFHTFRFESFGSYKEFEIWQCHLGHNQNIYAAPIDGEFVFFTQYQEVKIAINAYLKKLEAMNNA